MPHALFISSWIQVLKAPHGGWEENVTVAYESGAVEAMTVVIGLNKVCHCALCPREPRAHPGLFRLRLASLVAPCAPGD